MWRHKFIVCWRLLFVVTNSEFPARYSKWQKKRQPLHIISTWQWNMHVTIYSAWSECWKSEICKNQKSHCSLLRELWHKLTRPTPLHKLEVWVSQYFQACLWFAQFERWLGTWNTEMLRTEWRRTWQTPQVTCLLRVGPAISMTDPLTR